jgi:hypothetical protein
VPKVRASLESRRLLVSQLGRLALGEAGDSAGASPQYHAMGIPIRGSVTEAGCKVALTQDLKRSGMGLNGPGGQVVLTRAAFVRAPVFSAASLKSC